jgi:hypothetical protein
MSPSPKLGKFKYLSEMKKHQWYLSPLAPSISIPVDQVYLLRGFRFEDLHKCSSIVHRAANTKISKSSWYYSPLAPSFCIPVDCV